jgi:hypothetical protein
VLYAVSEVRVGLLPTGARIAVWVSALTVFENYRTKPNYWDRYGLFYDIYFWFRNLDTLNAIYILIIYRILYAFISNLKKLDCFFKRYN